MQTYKKILFAILLIVGINLTITLKIYAEDSSATTIDSAIPTSELQKLAIVLANVKKYYYRHVDNNTLFNNAISGMLSSLDPHSAYLNSDDLKELDMETSGKFGGVGIEVVPDAGAIKVVTPLDDTPAFRAGIKAGDYIIQINNKLVRNMTLNEALNLMRGPKGGKVSLTILRKNESKPLIFNLKRETIKIKTIKSKILENGYGYVRIAIFQDPTEKDLKKAVEKIKKITHGNLKGLILDVRNNPGGIFESSVQVADDFLDADKLKNNNLIVYTKGQSDEIQISAKATPGELIPNIPIVILINEGSASAAEILAGALQDHKRAIVVGTRSFGKGSVQTLIPIDQNSMIKLTTALYYTPLGRSIQAKGIEPDITIENLQIPEKKSELEALERINESNLIDHIQNTEANATLPSQDLTSEDEDEQNTQETELAYKDYQLYEALHILKSLNVLRHRTKQDE